MTQLSLLDANQNVADTPESVETRKVTSPSTLSRSAFSPPPGSIPPPTNLYTVSTVNAVPRSPSISTTTATPSQRNLNSAPHPGQWGMNGINASVPRTRMTPPPGDAPMSFKTGMDWPWFSRSFTVETLDDFPEPNYQPGVQEIDVPAVDLHSSPPPNNAAKGRISPYSSDSHPSLSCSTPVDSFISTIIERKPPISPVNRGPNHWQNDRPTIPRPPLYSNFSDKKMGARMPPPREEKTARFRDKVSHVEPSDGEPETDTYTDDMASSYTSRSERGPKVFEADSLKESPYTSKGSDGNASELVSIPASLISLGGHYLSLHKFLRDGKHTVEWFVISNPVDFTFYWDDYNARKRVTTAMAALPATQPPLKVMHLTFEKDVYPYTHTLWAAPGEESYVTIGDVLLGIHQACSGWISLEQLHNLDTESDDSYQREYARRVKKMAWAPRRSFAKHTSLKWSDTLDGRICFGGLVQNEYQNMHGLISWTVRLD